MNGVVARQTLLHQSRNCTNDTFEPERNLILDDCVENCVRFDAREVDPGMPVKCLDQRDAVQFTEFEPSPGIRLDFGIVGSQRVHGLCGLTGGSNEAGSS